MAVYLRGMNDEETAAFTLAMIDSGDARPERHRGSRWTSTPRGRRGQDHPGRRPAGRGLRGARRQDVGRGLGHTGGTLDKLEAIPGLRAI